MGILYFIIGILAFLLVLGISIGLHELGHLSVAKAFKLKVPKFFVGFGPTLFKKQIGQTSAGIKAIPLGGFVEIHDGRAEKTAEHEYLEKQVDETRDEIKNLKKQLRDRENVLTDEQKNRIKSDIKTASQRLTELNKDYTPIYEAYIHEKSLLSQVHPFKRILIFAAGPIVNLILGSIIIYSVLMGYPSMHVDTSVDTVNSCASLKQGETCGAEKGGMKDGDRILSVDGNEIKESSDISDSLKGKETVSIIVERNGSEISLPSVPVENGTIGVMLDTYEKPLSFTESSTMIGTVFTENVKAIVDIPEKVPGIVENIFGAEKDPEAPSSIVSVGKTYGDTSASDKITTDNKVKALLLYSGLLNFGLGLINLLCLLPLDGGKILIAVMDWFKMGFSKMNKKQYNPVSANSIKIMTVIMVIPVMSFMGLIILSDVLNIGRGWM